MNMRKLFSMVFSILLFLVAFGSISYAASISGTVKDDDGNPINNLHVFATDYTTNAWMANDYTDLNGNVCAVGASGGEQIWENAVNQYTVAGTIEEKGIVYVAGAGDPELRLDARKGTLTAFAADTGEKLWQKT